MSNIQITENESGKYSPEWFYNETQKPEWIAFIRKADTLHENFINHFGIEHLKSLSGKELLTSLFYNDKGNKLNLCYVLEKSKFISCSTGNTSKYFAHIFVHFKYITKIQFISFFIFVCLSTKSILLLSHFMLCLYTIMPFFMAVF